MQAIEEQIVLFLQQLMQGIGWGGVVVAMAIESANIPLPSEIIMPLAGWMLVEEPGGLLWAGFYGALGCTIGSAASYWLGTLGGRPFLQRYGRFLLISTHDLEVGERWFRRYGEATAFFSRLLPIVRTFISFPAGVARMNFPKFLFYTFAGSFPWCLALAWGGYFFGEHWWEVREFLRPFDIPIAVALLALGGVFIYRHLRRGSRQIALSVEERSE
ncbi:MAG: DedA family protein [Chloroflexi bacterium]|nr:DedA family protein [Chloroflexota bacterium]